MISNLIGSDDLMNLQQKRISVIPFFSAILILTHYILVNAVTPPSNAGMGLQYLTYWVLVAVSSIGTNLIALYLGYLAKSTKNPVKNLGRIAYYLILTGIISVIWAVLFFKAFTIKDLWITLVPITYNNFTFAASILVWYIAGPFLVHYIKNLSQNTRHTITLLLVWFVLIMPFIFAKPLWGMTDASSFIWVGFLFVFGILIENGEFKWLFQYKKNLITLFIGFCFIIITIKFSSLSNQSDILNNRFLASDFLNVGLISLTIFSLLVKFFSTHAKKNKTLSWVNWFTLISYFISCLPIITYHLSNELHISSNISSSKWIIQIFLYIVTISICVTLLTLVLNLMNRIKFVKKLIYQFPISSYSDIENSPQILLRLWKADWRLILVVFCGIIFSVFQMIMAYLPAQAFSITLVKTILTVLLNPLILNVIIFGCFFLLIFALINRFWPAIIFTSGASIFIGIAEYLKISLREEPIIPADLKMITSLSEILKMLSPLIIIAATIFLIILIISSILLQKRFNYMYSSYTASSWKKRGFVVLLMLFIFSGSFGVNYENSPTQIIFKAFGVNIEFWDQTGGAKVNGPVIQFINNLNIKSMNEPDGYSKSRVQAIMTKYDKQAAIINKSRQNTLNNQTVIFVLSESFSNPNRLPNMQVKPNPIPYLTSLKRSTNSGLMLSTGYGGGTANMEWQSLTGLSMSNLSPALSTPYTQLVGQQKSAPAFTNLFDSKVAIHPFNASLYNRKDVYKKFGFQHFYYEGSKDKLAYTAKLGSNPYISDDSAYKQTIKIAKQNEKGSRFIQLSTMQNHLPFTNYYDSKKYKIEGSAFDNSEADSVQTYTQGISYTDKALKKFIKSIDKLKQPVTVVWYGDHLASLYKLSMMEKYPIQLHETDYFVYSNQTHKVSYTNRIVSPYSFSALALSAAHAKVTPYYALITKITNKLPAMTIKPANTKSTSGLEENNIFVGQNGKSIEYNSLSKKQKKLYHDYLLIQYDLVAGKQYSAHWAEQKIKDE